MEQKNNQNEAKKNEDMELSLDDLDQVSGGALGDVAHRKTTPVSQKTKENV